MHIRSSGHGDEDPLRTMYEIAVLRRVGSYGTCQFLDLVA